MRTEDPNSYWKFWKSLKPRNSTKGPTLSQFVKYFEEQVHPPHVDYDHMNNIMKLVKSSPNDINEKVEKGQSDLLQFLNSPITIDEIQKAIRKFKCKKAAGIDGIPAEFYKHGSNELLPALVLLFNTIIANGEYPSNWATGIINPAHKKTAHNMPDNYRKVTVMPCIGNYLNLYLITILKTMYAMIMIPLKPALKVTHGRLIIYLYYVPL